MYLKDESILSMKKIKLTFRQNYNHINPPNLSRGEADCGVFGGWPFLAYQYVMRAVSTTIDL